MRAARPIVVGPRPSISAALDREPIVWLSSIRADGSPHLVPSWFAWDGESILVFSKPNAVKVRNVRTDRRVMLALGAAGDNFDVELIEATAELVPDATGAIMSDTFATKYGALINGSELTMDRFATTYSQPIRIHPTRWLGWGGPGWE
jgi:PPOX class probable F420-dependent enzyme